MGGKQDIPTQGRLRLMGGNDVTRTALALRRWRKGDIGRGKVSITLWGGVLWSEPPNHGVQKKGGIAWDSQAILKRP